MEERKINLSDRIIEGLRKEPFSPSLGIMWINTNYALVKHEYEWVEIKVSDYIKE